MRTLVDGNNVLYAIPRLRGLMIGKQIDAARRGLVELVSKLIKSGKLRAPVTVVFDGRSSGEAAAGASEEVAVRFAPHPDTADRLICETVEHGVDSGEYTVVTSDREVQQRCRRLGAKVLGVWKFLRDYVPEGWKPGAAGRAGRGRGRYVGLRPGRTNGRGAKGRGARRRAEREAPKDASSSEKPRGALRDSEVARWLEEFGFEE